MIWRSSTIPPHTVLYDGVLGAGAHTLTWHSGDVSSGLYLVMLDAAGCREHRKVVVLK